MVDQLSPLAPIFRPGSHGHAADGIGVTLSEIKPGSIVQLSRPPGTNSLPVKAVMTSADARLNVLWPDTYPWNEGVTKVGS